MSGEKWEPGFFPSGTCIVRDMASNPCTEPHYYVYGPANTDEDRYVRDRMQMCFELAGWLNGGSRPPWLDDLKRTSEEQCFDLDGTLISATGPSYDANPPALDWRQDNSEEAKSKRAALIDRLFGIVVAKV